MGWEATRFLRHLSSTSLHDFRMPNPLGAFADRVRQFPGVTHVRYSQDWIDTLALFVSHFEFGAGGDRDDSGRGHGDDYYEYGAVVFLYETGGD